jgi:hypothetical protein
VKRNIDEIWNIAEEALNDVYEKKFGKDIKEAFSDVAEDNGRSYADGCQAYRKYIEQIKGDSALDDFADCTREEIYKEFSDWYKLSDMFSKMTFSDLKDYCG